MKKCILLLIALSVLFIACDRGKTPVEPTEPTLEGVWLGTSHYTGPGPADEPIEFNEVIRFWFTDTTFAYAWGGFGAPLAPDSGRGYGHYEIVGDSISLTDLWAESYYPPLVLEGTFHLAFSDSTIVMRQVLHPWLWPETRTVTLGRVEAHLLGE